MKTIKEVLATMLEMTMTLEKLATACEKEEPMVAIAYRLAEKKLLDGWDVVSKSVEYAEEEKVAKSKSLRDLIEEGHYVRESWEERVIPKHPNLILDDFLFGDGWTMFLYVKDTSDGMTYTIEWDAGDRKLEALKVAADLECADDVPTARVTCAIHEILTTY